MLRVLTQPGPFADMDIAHVERLQCGLFCRSRIRPMW